MFKKKITQFLRYIRNTKSKHYYGNELNRYASLETCLNFYNNSSKKENVLTNTEIRFSPDIKFGSSIEHVKDNNPHECTILENTKDCTILFYRIKDGSHKFRLEMHFFKNKLVFFSYIFSSSQDKKIIPNLIAKKYLKSQGSILLNFSKNTLTDGFRNHVEMDDSVFLTIHYFTFRFGFFDYLKKTVNNHQIQKVRVNNSKESLLLNRI